MASVLAQVPRLPLSLDPLIAEAKRRAKQRRVLVLAVLVVIGITVGVVFALQSPGGPSVGGSSASRGVQSSAGLANLAVPVDPTERHWRQWIGSEALSPAVSRSLAIGAERAVRSHVAASGATVVRLRLWRTTAPPSVELVVATAIPAAVYLKYRMLQLFAGINSHYMFLEVVDRHGSKIIQFVLRYGHGTVYIRPGLEGCSPGLVLGLATNPPPCPAK